MDKRPVTQSPFTKETSENDTADLSIFEPANRKQKRLMEKGKKFLTKGGFYYTAPKLWGNNE